MRGPFFKSLEQFSVLPYRTRSGDDDVPPAGLCSEGSVGAEGDGGGLWICGAELKERGTANSASRIRPLTLGAF